MHCGCMLSAHLVIRFGILKIDFRSVLVDVIFCLLMVISIYESLIKCGILCILVELYFYIFTI